MLILTRKELCLGIYFVFDENKVIAVSEHGQIHQNLGACPKRDESSENKMIIIFSKNSKPAVGVHCRLLNDD